MYYLSPHEDVSFQDFQNRLANSELRFEPTPFEYVPHCTIVVLPQEPSIPVHTELMACAVPVDEITVSSVSFYDVDAPEQRCYQGERVLLGA